MDENFLLIYNPNFKPGQTYEIVLETDKILSESEKAAKEAAKGVIEKAFSFF